MKLSTVIFIIIVLQILINAIVVPIQFKKIKNQNKTKFRNNVIIVNSIILIIVIIIYLLNRGFHQIKIRKDESFAYDSEFSRNLKNGDPDYKDLITRIKQFHDVK